jgi:hypothetical protein
MKGHLLFELQKPGFNGLIDTGNAGTMSMSKNVSLICQYVILILVSYLLFSASPAKRRTG